MRDVHVNRSVDSTSTAQARSSTLRCQKRRSSGSRHMSRGRKVARTQASMRLRSGFSLRRDTNECLPVGLVLASLKRSSCWIGKTGSVLLMATNWREGSLESG